MAEGPKFMANMPRALRNKPPKRAGKKNKKKSETAGVSSKKRALSSEQENQKQSEKSKGKGKEIEKKKGKEDKGERDRGYQEGDKEETRRRAKTKREPIQVIESHVKIGVSRSDICLFGHWVIGFLRHLSTEWVQIIFDIECGAEQENTSDYLLLSSCPSTPTLSNPYPSSPHKTEQFASVYATWTQLQRIRIRIQELPGISDQLLLDHCVVLLEYFREKGIKEGSRWMWHPEEVELLDRFLGCEICFWVGEAVQDEKKQSVGNAVNVQETEVFAIECAMRSLRSIDEVLQEEFAGVEGAASLGMIAKPKENAAEDRYAIPDKDISVEMNQGLTTDAGFQDNLSMDNEADNEEIPAPENNHPIENGAANSDREKDKDAAIQKDKVLGGVAPIYLSFSTTRPSATSIEIEISEMMAAEKSSFAQKSLVEGDAAMAETKGADVQTDISFKDIAPLKHVEFAESSTVAEKREIAESPITEPNEKVKGEKIKSNKSIKKLEVIWEEEDQPTELMIALRAVGMVEIGGFCYCWDRCALNKDLDPEIYEPAVAFPVRERMKIKRRNYQSECSPDRFLLRERKLLGIRKS